MRALIQRVSAATVYIDGQPKSSIQQGLLIFLGIEAEDGMEDIRWLAGKISRLRIFNDTSGLMNLSLLDLGLEAMVISQFTLHAGTKKGNRPSYIKSAPPEIAEPLYEQFNKVFSELTGKEVPTGEFGAKMDISLVNDGPVTLFIDTKNKE